MENNIELINTLLGDRHTLLLMLTVGFGLLIGKVMRTFVKIVAYTVGAVALFLLGLQYLGVIYIAVNQELVVELVQALFVKARSVGVAEHLFFWVPFVYAFRSRNLLKTS
ncbi:MAG TPA: hypothetical protein ENJ29_08275 [Bacteroidetes bacterium]|nr:hypothetical protein [Bacteroidota bacterium]